MAMKWCSGGRRSTVLVKLMVSDSRLGRLEAADPSAIGNAERIVSIDLDLALIVGGNDVGETL
jgi:hypothetical protein